MIDSMTFDLVVSSLPESYIKFVMDFLKHNKGEFIEGLLRIVIYANVHISMAKLVKVSVKRKEEERKAKAKLNVESQLIS